MTAVRIAAVLAVAMVAGTGLGWAQMGAEPGTGHAHMQQHAGAADSASTAAYRAAMAKMMRAMNIPYTGDADRDFVAGMLPHHQGAVDMAEVELRYGHDPELRKLAEDIVAAQQKEIAFMTAWQAKHR